MRKELHFTDVVCGMDITEENITTEYQGIPYAFCSEQCMQRFESNPHLYIGFPGIEAPKHAGMDAIRSRTLMLSEPIAQELADKVVDAVLDMMSVQTIIVQDNFIKVTYDLLQATEAQIVAAIINAGAALDDGWKERVKRALIESFEETQLASLEASPKSMSGHSH